MHRRHFLLAAPLAAASAPRAVGANDTIRVACVGTGGRCRVLMKSLAGIPGAQIVGVSDVWDAALAEGKKLADPNAVAARDYRALLDRKDVDAVLIGAPDHWHAAMTVDACRAGKDVYVEKPLTHDLSEGEAVIRAQDEHKRIVQVGTQQRSMPHIARAKQRIAEGAIGTVLKVRMSWNRNSERVRRNDPKVDPTSLDWKMFCGTAKAQPFDGYRFRNWRWFWDFGGGIFSDLMVHWVDVAHWVLNLDAPLSAKSVGEWVNAKGVWETPDTVQTLLTYPGGVQMHFEGTFSNASRGAHIEFLGTEGALYVDRGAYILTPDWNKKGKAEEMILGTSPRRGADFYDKPDGERVHLENWLSCVRTREKPAAPAEAGVSGAAAAHLANAALKEKRD